MVITTSCQRNRHLPPMLVLSPPPHFLSESQGSLLSCKVGEKKRKTMSSKIASQEQKVRKIRVNPQFTGNNPKLSLISCKAQMVTITISTYWMGKGWCQLPSLECEPNDFILTSMEKPVGCQIICAESKLAVLNPTTSALLRETSLVKLGQS